MVTGCLLLRVVFGVMLLLLGLLGATVVGAVQYLRQKEMGSMNE